MVLAAACVLAWPLLVIKRIGFGFRNFENYRIRALLYAGKPNLRVLGSIVIR
jgi:hypothetical protein